MSGLTSGWKKSSRSNGSSSCVEARGSGGRVEFRDSKHLAGPVLSVPADDHRRFLDAIKAGSFDLT